MYALINTMTKTGNYPGDVAGTVISCHRTIAAAEKADGKLQRMTRKANGSGSYLPTNIVQFAPDTKPFSKALISNEEIYHE